LKFPESASTAHHEYKVYTSITDVRKQNLVHLEIIEFSNLPPRHASQNCALKMPRYTSTLQSCAQDPELGTLFEHVALSVFDGLCAMHTTEYCHLDVKPGNIFIDSNGGVFLGDFDAALIVGQAVDRTTPTFLPRELAILKAKGLLIASPVIDFGMLACTLMYMLDAKYLSSPSTPEIESTTQNLDVNRHPQVARILLECVRKLRQDAQIEMGTDILKQMEQRRSISIPNGREIGSESTHSGLEPLL
jgi:serine/threonine protein kinase